MERIAIIGCGGSGKSALARRVGAALGLPVLHLDRYYWKPGWVETPRDDWARVHRSLCEGKTWIMDGNYGGTMDLRLAMADTVVFLDLPTRTCLTGALRRYLRYRGRTRPELEHGCTERLGSDYIRWIWTYRRTRRPRILERLRALEPFTRVEILGSRAAVETFVESLPGGRPPSG